MGIEDTGRNGELFRGGHRRFRQDRLQSVSRCLGQSDRVSPLGTGFRFAAAASRARHARVPATARTSECLTKPIRPAFTGFRAESDDTHQEQGRHICPLSTDLFRWPGWILRHCHRYSRQFGVDLPIDEALDGKNAFSYSKTTPPNNPFVSFSDTSDFSDGPIGSPQVYPTPIAAPAVPSRPLGVSDNIHNHTIGAR